MVRSIEDIFLYLSVSMCTPWLVIKLAIFLLYGTLNSKFCLNWNLFPSIWTQRYNKYLTNLVSFSPCWKFMEPCFFFLYLRVLACSFMLCSWENLHFSLIEPLYTQVSIIWLQMNVREAWNACEEPFDVLASYSGNGEGVGRNSSTPSCFTA